MSKNNEISFLSPYELEIPPWKIFLISKNKTLMIKIYKFITNELFENEFELNNLHKNKLLMSKLNIKEIIDFIIVLSKQNNISIIENKDKLTFSLISTLVNHENVDLILDKKQSEEIIKLIISQNIILKEEYEKIKKENNILIQKNSEEIKILENKIKDLEDKIFNINNKNKIQLTKCNLHLLNVITGAHTKIITSVSIFPSGNFISVSKDKTIKIWDNKEFHCIQTIRDAHSKGIAFVNIKDDFNFITSSADFDIKIWCKKKSIFELFSHIENAHSDKIGKVIFCNDGNIISCSKDSKIKIWEMNNEYKYQSLCIFHEEGNCFFSILYIENKKLLIASSDISTIIYNIKNHSKKQEFKDIICQSWNSLEKINDDKIIIGGGNDFIIKVMDINDFFIQNIQNDFNCFGICNIENKGVFLVCGMSYEIAIFRSDNYEKIFVYQNAHSEYIYGINYMENGLILSYSKDSNINIWYL